MKTILAWVGGVVLALSFMGAVGLGNFLIKYSTQPIICS